MLISTPQPRLSTFTKKLAAKVKGPRKSQKVVESFCTGAAGSAGHDRLLPSYVLLLCRVFLLWQMLFPGLEVFVAGFVWCTWVARCCCLGVALAFVGPCVAAIVLPVLRLFVQSPLLAFVCFWGVGGCVKDCISLALFAPFVLLRLWLGFYV
ncbi:hypothetical protein Patl1_21247 [Pistacia atlantica]|uniref:Uncharacterized protein n=1 Tax=Pistacia atlantica TaxID=434234 RepID=A0ACC1BJ69_9ROSI|nr:hypothetical protein Patl1_21247 [Pistacia atlantica]